jgi:hypothetical protein
MRTHVLQHYTSYCAHLVNLILDGHFISFAGGSITLEILKQVKKRSNCVQ